MMNGYEINAAVKAAMAARRKLWLAGMEVGAEVRVQNYGRDTTAVVSRITATLLILSSGQRVNKDNGLIRGAGGYNIYELGAAEIERAEREKVTAAAELLAERVAYSLSERREGRNNEPLAVGDAVVTADGQTGIVARLWASTTVVVLDKPDSRGRKVQATFKKGCVYKLLNYLAKLIECGESVAICEKEGTVRTVTPTPALAPTRRAPGAGRPRLAAPTKQVFGRIPASLLPELIKRGGVARVLIDALSKKLT